MALPASGQIDLNQVNVEIGNSGTAQISLNDANVRTLFNIASGQISMDDGHGKAWLRASVTDQSISLSLSGPGTLTTGYKLTAAGNAVYTNSNNTYGGSISGEWKQAGASGSFEARMTMQSGTTFAGPIGTWVNLSGDIPWFILNGNGGFSALNGTGLLEIRRTTDNVVITSAHISITCTKTP